jgi:RNA polymerase sigma-70 factor (ECF subfamily)
VLRADATLEATPFREWQAGRAICIHMLDTNVLGAPGDWRMIATTANGQPAAVVYRRDADSALQADGAVVLAPTATGVSRVIKFHDPALVLVCSASRTCTQTDPGRAWVARSGSCGTKARRWPVLRPA